MGHAARIRQITDKSHTQYLLKPRGTRSVETSGGLNFKKQKLTSIIHKDPVRTAQ